MLHRLIRRSLIAVAHPLALVALAALPGCITASPDPLTPQELAHATYDSPTPAEGMVTLSDGAYAATAAPGSASSVSITLLDDLTAYGDLDGDAVADAAVILAGSGGGSGTFVTLAAVRNQAGEPQHIASAYLGDRVVVSSVEIDGGKIVVSLTEHGPSDPLCCPTVEAVRTFQLADGALSEITAPP
jgi:hypothetical protein